MPESNRVYLDEFGSNLGMTRTHARSPEGERVYSKRLANYGGNISVVACMRLGEKVVSYPFDGAVDGYRFLQFIDEEVLKILKHGDFLIMDNVRMHHIAEVKEKLATVGATPLFLPPYSPELNPIEEAFSLIKGTLKGLEARTIAAYVDALEIARTLVTPEKIRAYFDHANSFLQGSPCGQL